ncbi:MAG: prephenate dehydratase domain-containing protein [Chloroflexota bacterium]
MGQSPAEPSVPLLHGGPVAFAGEPGAFAEDAVIAAFGPDVQRHAVGSFLDVFRAVTEGRAGSGMLPIENLLNGTVRENLDLLLEHELVVIGEVVVPVRLSLAALPGQTLDDIERVYSHIQALGQAEAFLRSRPWTTLTTYNTAGAGRIVRDAGEHGAAAVLSPRAAALFGLEVLASDIQGGADNRTRFLVVGTDPGAEASIDESGEGTPGAGEGTPGAGEGTPGAGRPWRTTVAFAVRNEPGTLLHALRAFADRGVNLSSLESRPSRTAAWEYVFWADVDAASGEPACAAALDDLHGVSTMVRILGSYPRATESIGS